MKDLCRVHGLKSPGHMQQVWKVLYFRVLLSCSAFLFSTVWKKRWGRLTLPLYLAPHSLCGWKCSVTTWPRQCVLVPTRGRRGRCLPLSVGARLREGPHSQEGLNGFSLPKRLHPSPKTHQPCSTLHHTPGSFPHFFLALPYFFYSTRKEGCFLFHQHVLPWRGGGRETKYVSSRSWLLILPWTGSSGELFRSYQSHWM